MKGKHLPFCSVHFLNFMLFSLKMAELDIDEVTSILKSTRVSARGVSFAGLSLKLNTENDAEPVVHAINNCDELEYLNLEGNTLGVDASKAIAKALELHTELKRALWKDMFTGRMKTEIPKALEFLGKGLVTAGARLTELDLSDNAFGPIGVEGLAALLRSSSCYALEELRLNNNGLGIGGGRLLASALLDCYNCSKNQGKPLSLKVFIAGRNRLENDGAKALAHVFETIGTLEEIAMPQNGIYHIGITALSNAFKNNPNLQILNLNDNTIGSKGSKAIALVLPHLKNLREINFGDCLLRNKGAISLAEGLRECPKLEHLALGFNEIRADGGKELIKALMNKEKLNSISLDGNQFGSKGQAEIKTLLRDIGKLNALGSLSEDESGDSEEEDDVDEDYDDDNESAEDSEGETDNNNLVKRAQTLPAIEFLNKPSADNFLALGVNAPNMLLEEAEKNNQTYLESLVCTLMKVASLNVCKSQEVVEKSLSCTDQLYQQLFSFGKQEDNYARVNNCLLVNFGLIKNEDKIKPTWNLDGCLRALYNILKKNKLPESTKNTLKLFLQKDIDNGKDFLSIKKDILAELN